MLKKYLDIILVVLLFFVLIIFFIPRDKFYIVENVLSPTNFQLDKLNFIIDDLESFDDKFTLHNAELAKKLNITETEAFILGNLSKYWASNLMKGRKVLIKNNDLIFYKYSYRIKYLYSGYCLKDSNPYFKSGFDKKVAEIRRSKFTVMDLETENYYNLDEAKIRELKNFIVIKRYQASEKKPSTQAKIKTFLENGDIKIYFTDLTTKLKADRDCSSDICKEILANINSATKSIDMAIYGYSRTYAIENALQNAIKRGVKIRLIYDLDSQGKNIYPDTKKLISLIADNKNDGISAEAQSIMHNKFYIFDDKTLITGSANLSHTDMSGFNSNSIVVINSAEIAKIYKKEFEQMYLENFHNSKTLQTKNKIKISDIELEVYFSPQDKTITNVVLPLIKNAKSYIYIPTFVLTEKRVTEELIKAKQRGVDVRIIIDALNASIKHSKHKELRAGNVLVKTENYAGKMHSKSMIIDDKYTIIGSMNFSYSGENRNDENLIVIKDSKTARFYKDFFLYQWDKIDNKWLKLNARAEGKDSIGSCFDGIDNNYDGLIDGKDPACK